MPDENPNPCAQCEDERTGLIQLLADMTANRDYWKAQASALAADGMVMDTTDLDPNVRLVVIGCTTEDAARAAIQNSIYKPAAVVRAGTLFGVGGGVLRLDLD